MSAMTAAELGFRDAEDGEPQWVALVQAVYNMQLAKIDDVCNGGLRWQALEFLNGFDYKNSISNGCFFNIASRLALYTGNSSYADEAEVIWEWMEGVGFIDPKYNVFDGAGVKNGANCTEIYKAQFSYNAGVFLHGAAAMYKFVSSSPLIIICVSRSTQSPSTSIILFFQCFHFPSSILPYLCLNTNTHIPMYSNTFTDQRQRNLANPSSRPPNPNNRHLLPRRNLLRSRLRESPRTLHNRHALLQSLPNTLDGRLHQMGALHARQRHARPQNLRRRSRQAMFRLAG